MTDETLPNDLTPDELEALGEPAHSTEPADHADENEHAGSVPPPLLRAEALDAAPLLAELASHQDAWATRFDDGDITAKEYAAGLERLADKREEVRWAARKAELAEEMSEAQRFNQWAGAVKDFMTTTGKQIAANVGANGAPGPLLIAFDDAVKKAHADPANRGLSDKAILNKAHRMFRADLDTTFGRPETSMGGVDHGSLAKLGPLELEDALLAMTPREREQYLA
jgi:hypothetical protein